MEASGAKFLLFLIAAVIALLSKAAKRPARKKNDYAAQQPTGAAKTSEEVSPLRTGRAQKREAVQRAEQWRAAKIQQDDARQVHSINMDSCENRLESLRVLYEAGILDREEYAQRVARVKSRHAHSAN